MTAECGAAAEIRDLLKSRPIRCRYALKVSIPRYVSRALLVWTVLIGVEFLHRLLRAILLAPYVGDFRSRQIGAVIGSFLVVAVAYLLIGWIAPPTRNALLTVGGLWLSLTLIFEFAFGRLAGLSWERLVSDYDLRRGGLLSLGMIVLALSPLIASRLRVAERHPT